MKENIDAVDDALIYLEQYHGARYNAEPWTSQEMRQLKTRCKDFDFGPDLYRAMVAFQNNWTSRGGRVDINQVEVWMRQYYGE